MHRTARRFVVVVLILMALIGCRGGSLPWMEESDFGPYVRELDTLSLHHTYDSLIRVDTSQWKAVITVKEHYKKTKQSLWFDRSGISSDADLLVEILRKELPRHGLDTTAFGIPQIAADLRVVHVPVSPVRCTGLKNRRRRHSIQGAIGRRRPPGTRRKMVAVSPACHR